MVKGFFSRTIGLFLLTGVLCLSLVACWESNLSGNTYVEPEITVDYLVTEFANQITRDGAEKLFGVIDKIHDNKDGTYTLTVIGKQFVNDSSQPNGFYIADRNINYELILSENVRSVLFPSNNLEDGSFFLNSVDFIQAFNNSESTLAPGTFEEEGLSYFYFYLMYDFVELIIQQFIL